MSFVLKRINILDFLEECERQLVFIVDIDLNSSLLKEVLLTKETIDLKKDNYFTMRIIELAMTVVMLLDFCQFFTVFFSS